MITKLGALVPKSLGKGKCLFLASDLDYNATPTSVKVVPILSSESHSIHGSPYPRSNDDLILFHLSRTTLLRWQFPIMTFKLQIDSKPSMFTKLTSRLVILRVLSECLLFLGDFAPDQPYNSIGIALAKDSQGSVPIYS